MLIQISEYARHSSSENQRGGDGCPTTSPNRGLGMRELCEPGSQQSARSFASRNLNPENLTRDLCNFSDAGLQLGLASAAQGAGCQVRFDPRCVSRRDFPFSCQKQILIGDMAGSRHVQPDIP